MHTTPLTPPLEPSGQLLHLSQARMAVLLEHLPVGVLCADTRGMIRAMNRACREILAYAGAVPGQNLRHFPPLVMSGLAAPLARFLDAQTEFDGELTVHGSGETGRCRVRGRVVREAGGAVLEYLLLLDPPREGPLDDLERVRLQRQLQRSQRMESFGLLAAGIVHDLNNVLACILGAAELLERQDPEPSDGALVRQISEATQRGALMTRKVLSLARLEEGSLETVGLQQVIRDVMVLMRRSVDPRIEIRLHLPPQGLEVKADTTTLHQMLMNLCVNARDAMPEGGELYVAGARIQAVEAAGDSPAPGESCLSLGDRSLLEGDPERELVRVEVRDTGTGIEPCALHRIFDPFFTTKQDDRGTGLGLAMVRRAVEELGGLLMVTTRKDWGTSFRLFFPWVEDAPAPQPARPQREAVTGRGRVMVVDDDEVVRSTMCDLIRTLGYEVEAMPDGLAAVEAFMRDPEAWDLVLLDLMMPRMDGVEALRRIRAIRQDQSVLVVTGFAGQQNIQKLEQIARVPLLMKPIQIRELSRWIADLIN